MKKADDFRKAFGPATPGFESVVKKTIKELRAQEIKPVVKEWRRWRRPVFAMAMVLVLFIGFVAVNGTLNPFSRTDRIRSEEENLYTAQPITTVLSMGAGQEEVEGNGAESVLSEEESIRMKLDERFPGLGEKMLPVNLASEKQGLRVEVVSGYVSGMECYFVISIEDLEGKYRGCDVTPSYVCDIASYSAYSIMPLYESKEENKTVYLFVPELNKPVTFEDRTITTGIERFKADQFKAVDLLPLLQQYGKTVEGVEQPQLDWYPGSSKPAAPKELKVLDYEQPLDIPLFGDVCLSGIGWIDGQLHVQFHNTGNSAYHKGNVTYGTWNVWNYGKVDDKEYSPLRWRMNNDNGVEWEEYVYDVKPEEMEGLELRARISVLKEVLDDKWTVEIPLKAVCADVQGLEPEIEERLTGFMTAWSTLDYDGMLVLCDPEWQESTGEPLQRLAALTQNATLLDSRCVSIVGKAEDTVRTLICATNIQRPGNMPHTSFRLNVEVKKAADGLWYVNPESLKNWIVTEDIREEPVEEDTEESGPLEEMEEDFGDIRLDDREGKIVFDVYAGTKVYTKNEIGYALREDGTAEAVATSVRAPYQKEINIPERVRDYIVTAIGAGAFSGYSTMFITLPDTVKSIGRAAFDDCDKLVYLSIPDGVPSIENAVFYNCTSLTDVAIPDSVTAIGNEAFYCCQSLAAVRIPEKTVSIGDYAFLSCKGLTSVTLPESLNTLGSYAFSKCSGLESIEVPGSVISVGKGAFKGCDGLKTAQLREGIAQLGEDAFSECSSLETVELPNSLLSIGERAFRECVSLKKLILPEGLTSIDRAAFMNCTRLEELVIPESVTSLGVHVFRGCINLTCIVKDGSYAMSYCEENGIRYVVR